MTVNFAWNSPRSTLWRLKLEAFCKENGYLDTGLVRIDYGPRWAYRLRDSIAATPLPSHELTRLRTYPGENGVHRVALAVYDRSASERDIIQAVFNMRGIPGKLIEEPDLGGMYDNGPNAAW
jgi:hypothetical protein